MSATKTYIQKLESVVIPVADQDRAIDFYTTKLGFELLSDTPFGGEYRWVEVGLGEDETKIALAPPPPDRPEAAGKRETGISLYAPDIDAFHAELQAAGVDVDPEVSRMEPPVPPLFWLRDPEGNVLMVVG